MSTTYKFKNNGDSCEITITNYPQPIGIHVQMRNLQVSNFDVNAITLVSEDKTDVGFFKKTVRCFSLLIDYLANGTLYRTSIAIAKNEVELAQSLCVEAQKQISYFQKRKEILAEEEKMKREDTVDAITTDGQQVKIWRKESFGGNIVLVVEDGTTYHTHADCFEKWKPMYRRNFKGWQMVKKTDVLAKGMCECRFCERYYDDLYDDIDE